MTRMVAADTRKTARKYYDDKRYRATRVGCPSLIKLLLMPRTKQLARSASMETCHG